MATYSGVSWEELDASILMPPTTGGVVAATLRTLKGIIGTAVKVRSWTEFEGVCGGLTESFYDPLWAKAVLDRGCHLWISRVVHATDPTNIATITATKATIAVPDRDTASPAELTSSVGPFNLAHNDDLVMDIDGVPELAITISAVRASVESTALGNFTGGKILNLKIDQGATQYITFINGDFVDPANPTAAEVALVINTQGLGLSAVVVNPGLVTLYSDTYGDGSYVQVTGGTANALLIYTTVAQQGSGNVIDVSAVTAAEIVTLLQGLAQEGTTWYAEETVTGAIHVYTVAEGSAIHIGCDAPSLMAAKIGWTAGAGGDATGTDVSGNTSITINASSEGTWAAGIIATVQNNSVDATRFDIIIAVQSGDGYSITTEEIFDDLTVDNNDARYVCTVINESSRWIDVVDNASVSVAPLDEPLAGSYTLAGGNTGLVGLVGADYLGDAASGLGVHTFDALTYVGDGLLDIMTPYMTTRATAYSITQLAADRRDIVYHQTNPDIDSSSDAIAWRNATGAYVASTKYNTSYSAMVTGSGKVRNPNNGGYVWIDALAGLCEVLSYTDTGKGKVFKDIGPWFAPCGEKRGKCGAYLEIYPNYGSRGQRTAFEALEDAHINRLLDYGNGPIIWDQRTLVVNRSVFEDLNIRRGMIAVEQLTLDAIRAVNWEPLDLEMFREAYRIVKPIWENYKRKRGCTDFAIYCDQDAKDMEDLVVQDALDDGKFKMNIYCKPTRAARTLQVTFVGTSSAMDFSEIEL